LLAEDLNRRNLLLYNITTAQTTKKTKPIEIKKQRQKEHPNKKNENENENEEEPSRDTKATTNEHDPPESASS